MTYRIGVFSRYKQKRDPYQGYHGSPCKIFKIINELNSFFDFKCYYNDYSEPYDFAIVDRITPRRRIKSNYILGIFEATPGGKWATDYCSISPSSRKVRDGQFFLLNYCHGKKITLNTLSKNRSNGVYLGRLDSPAELKIKALNRERLSLDIFPIKYWDGKRVLRFHRPHPEAKRNIAFLKKKIPKSNILYPVRHDKLCDSLNKGGYAYGFVPSIYSLQSKRSQIESSSKFFEYIGAGIPVLIEKSVPEASIVRKAPFLGEIFSGEADMIRKARKLSSNKYSYLNILKFSQREHFPDSRALLLYNEFIKDRL
jgi:hypothetical protein